jgi:hypothetical protein
MAGFKVLELEQLNQSCSREPEFAPYGSPLFNLRRLTSAATHFLSGLVLRKPHQAPFLATEMAVITACKK